MIMSVNNNTENYVEKFINFRYAHLYLVQQFHSEHYKHFFTTAMRIPLDSCLFQYLRGIIIQVFFSDILSRWVFNFYFAEWKIRNRTVHKNKKYTNNNNNSSNNFSIIRNAGVCLIYSTNPSSYMICSNVLRVQNLRDVGGSEGEEKTGS